MLNVNQTEYDLKNKYINFDSFEAPVDGKKREGNALYITLITDDFKLSIETVYDVEWINELKVDDKKDISKYVVDLPYEDEKGWICLTNECNCTLCKIDDQRYEINLSGHFEEGTEQFDIEYSDIFEI